LLFRNALLLQAFLWDVLLPTGNIVLGWSILMMILLMYLASVLPYAVAFGIDFVSVHQAILSTFLWSRQLAATCSAACLMSTSSSNMQQTVIVQSICQSRKVPNRLPAAWCCDCRATLPTRCLCWTLPSI
jgi:hypothetical protein